jgi:peptidyl-tRNA hydrolase, PTH2 family
MKYGFDIPRKLQLGNHRTPSRLKAIMDKIPDDWRSREGIGLLAGLVIGVLCRGLINKISSRTGRGRVPASADDLSSDEELDDSRGPSAGGESKLVFCVRSDLKMQKGKIAAQVGHATLGAYKKARRNDAAALRRWEHNAQPKIALQIGSNAEAKQLEASARKRGLVTYTVHDAGRTQVAAVRLRYLFLHGLVTSSVSNLGFLHWFQLPHAVCNCRLDSHLKY